MHELDGGVTLRIRSNWSALRTVRALNTAVGAGDANIERLSTGTRVVRAGDDAAGLGIAQRLRAQYMGLMRANRNAADGLSLVNTADGALGEVHGLLQRLRELAVRAGNGTWDATDIKVMQNETNHLLREIDRIADSVKWNGMDVIAKGGSSGAISDVIFGLTNGWLEQAATIIENAYGIRGDGAQLEIVFEQAGNRATWISGTPGAWGQYDNLKLHVNMDQFESGGFPDGGNGPFYHDRKIARALTEAVIARNSNMVNLTNSNDYWFISGAASYISGYDSELAQALTRYTAAEIIGTIGSPWVEDDLHRAGAYLSAKYLEWRFGPAALQSVFTELQSGWDLSTAMSNSMVGMGLPFYVSDFQANAAAFLATLDLTDDDVGGFFGGNPITVIPNVPNFNPDPLNPNFGLNFGQGTSSAPMRINLQVGANATDKLTLEYAQVNTLALGLTGINLASNTGRAIELYDAAINQVSTTRTSLGAAANRLQSVMNTNGWSTEGQLGGYSRIVDLDMAREISHLARNQLLRDSATAMLVQANVTSESMITLMEAMPSLFDLSSGGLPSLSKR